MCDISSLDISPRFVLLPLRLCSKLCSGLVAILYSVFLILYFVEALFEALLWTLLRNYILSFGYLYYIDVCSAHSSKQVLWFYCNKNRTSVWHSLGCVTWILYFLKALLSALLRNYIFSLDIIFIEALFEALL